MVPCISSQRMSYTVTSTELHPKSYCSKLLCVRVWRIVCTGVHICEHEETRGQPWVSFIRYGTLCLLRLGFSLVSSSQSGLGSLAREPLGSTYLCLPSSRITMINHHDSRFKQKLMIRLRSSFLQGKKSDSWGSILSCLPNLLSPFNSLC